MKSPENFKKSIPENIKNGIETQKGQNLQETNKRSLLEATKNFFNKMSKIDSSVKIIILETAVLAEIMNPNSPTHKKLMSEIEYFRSENNKEYSVKNSSVFEKHNINKFFEKDFIKKVAIEEKKEELNDLLERKERDNFFTQESLAEGWKPDKIDSLTIENNKKKIDLDIKKTLQKTNGELTEEDIKTAKEKIIYIINIIEEAKKELIKHIQSDAYLIKIMNEFNVSKEEAKEHQNIRINNIKNVSYDLRSSEDIKKESPTAYAFYKRESNKIVLPYDRNLTLEDEKKIFYESVLHEILHESTMSEKGMSKKSNYLLNKFFEKRLKESDKDIEYFSNPVELIVRKQNLDLEMEKLGIKKYGEEFKKEHYLILLKLKEKNKLSDSTIDFIEHIKIEEFSDLMNELAQFDEGGKVYYPKELWGKNQDYSV